MRWKAIIVAEVLVLVIAIPIIISLRSKKPVPTTNLLSLLKSTFNKETEGNVIDLKALAKKARPAVMLLVVSDANGKEIGTGTGFLVSSDGKLITNFHVIKKAARAVAKTEKGGLFPVEGVLASDPKNDLVVLKLGKRKRDAFDEVFDEERKKKGLPPEPVDLIFPFLPLGKSENIEVGTRIAVIGSPLGLEGTLSEGIVSAVRELRDGTKVLQVTAAISRGSSGSPVINAKGDVVGIASALLRGGQALNFAVPVQCGIHLMAKVKPSLAPQPLNQLANAGGEDAIFSDTDWRSLLAAEAAGDYVEMLKRAKALVARYPDNGDAWGMLGWAFGKLKFTEDAIAAYRQAIKLKPDDALAWFGLGVEYCMAGRWDDATLAFRQAVKIKPDADYAWRGLGKACHEAGLWDDAVAAYLQGIKLKPDNAEAWYGLAVTYNTSGRTDDAIAAFKRAIKIEPDFAEAWYNLGIAYQSAGRETEADAAFRRVRELKPDLLR